MLEPRGRKGKGAKLDTNSFAEMQSENLSLAERDLMQIAAMIQRHAALARSRTEEEKGRAR